MDGTNYRGWRSDTERETASQDRAAIRVGLVMAAALMTATAITALAVGTFAAPSFEPPAFWAAGSLG